MIPLNSDEVDEIITLAHKTAEEYILEQVNKKDLEDIDITINLDTTEDSFSIDVNITLDADIPLPCDLSQKATDKTIAAVDRYVENRKNPHE